MYAFFRVEASTDSLRVLQAPRRRSGSRARTRNRVWPGRRGVRALVLCGERRAARGRHRSTATIPGPAGNPGLSSRPSEGSLTSLRYALRAEDLPATKEALAVLDVSCLLEILALPCLFRSASRDAAEPPRGGARPIRRSDRFHEREVGPHPRWSYQIAFAPIQFSDVVGWLTLNHGALDVFVHPNTGHELRGHRDSALWSGRSNELDLRAGGG